jgi:hypothetical protein
LDLDALRVALVTAGSALLLAVACGGQRIDLTDSGLPDAGVSDAGDGGAACILTRPCVVESNQDLYVDGFAGQDGPCCCGSVDRPCHTLAGAMQLILAANANSVVVHAFNSDGSPEWTTDETWPVSLCHGVTLRAPGVYFNDPAATCQGDTCACTIGFCATACDDSDVLPVALEGDDEVDGGYVNIGIPYPVTDAGATPGGSDSFNVAVTSNPWGNGACACPELDGGRQITQSLPLRLSHAWINGAANSILVSADLTLGPLPVHVGSWDGRSGVTGEAGLLCANFEGLPIALQDEGSHVLQVDSQFQYDLSTGPSCTTSLTKAPSFGLAPDGGGFETCGGLDYIGAWLSGPSVIGSLEEPASIQCQTYAGIQMNDSSPNVSFTGRITSNACFGALVDVGHLALLATHIDHASTGVLVNGTGQVDLSGTSVTPQPAPNELSCYEQTHPPCKDWIYPLLSPVAGLVNATTATVDARNVSWAVWDVDAGQPPAWSCADTDFQSCTCSGSGCADGGSSPPVGATAVSLSSNPHPFDFSGGSQSMTTCN